MPDEQGNPQMLETSPHALFEEQAGLARIYMEDGAFRTGANVLRKLADRLDEHIDAVDTKYLGAPLRTSGWGVQRIATERQRQIEKEGHSSESDDNYVPSDIAGAAACYILVDLEGDMEAGWSEKIWPWAREWWKPKDRLQNLTRAGALIAAEIDRLMRKAHRDSNAED